MGLNPAVNRKKVYPNWLILPPESLLLDHVGLHLLSPSNYNNAHPAEYPNPDPKSDTNK